MFKGGLLFQALHTPPNDSGGKSISITAKSSCLSPKQLGRPKVQGQGGELVRSPDSIICAKNGATVIHQEVHEVDLHLPKCFKEELTTLKKMDVQLVLVFDDHQVVRKRKWPNLRSRLNQKLDLILYFCKSHSHMDALTFRLKDTLFIPAKLMTLGLQELTCCSCGLSCTDPCAIIIQDIDAPTWKMVALEQVDKEPVHQHTKSPIAG